MNRSLPAETVLSGLRAAGEETRLRILVLLGQGELNVKDLTWVLGQSQPRISRHLKLLVDAGLVDRFREGSWTFFRLAGTARANDTGQLARMIIAAVDLDDPDLARDRARCAELKSERTAAAQSYFQDQAENWDRLRSLHVDDAQVESAVLAALGDGPIERLIDIGTGTGRMLEVCGERVVEGIGIDLNQSMLAYARSKLEAAGLDHCQVRQGDIYNLPFEDASADAVVIHQVLHFLDDPLNALREAARVLAPGGRMLVVDFAPHEVEFLREQYAHQRLGFSEEQMRDWFDAIGLKLRRHQTLAPRAAGEGAPNLTVSVWHGERERDTSPYADATTDYSKTEISV